MYIWALDAATTAAREMMAEAASLAALATTPSPSPSARLLVHTIGIVRRAVVELGEGGVRDPGALGVVDLAEHNNQVVHDCR